MTTENNNENATSEIQSKSLMVLGVTFILPIIICLIAVWIYI